jgi:hypothetical protein
MEWLAVREEMNAPQLGAEKVFNRDMTQILRLQEEEEKEKFERPLYTSYLEFMFH